MNKSFILFLNIILKNIKICILAIIYQSAHTHMKLIKQILVLSINLKNGKYFESLFFIWKTRETEFHAFVYILVNNNQNMYFLYFFLLNIIYIFFLKKKPLTIGDNNTIFLLWIFYISIS